MQKEPTHFTLCIKLAYLPVLEKGSGALTSTYSNDLELGLIFFHFSILQSKAECYS